MRVRSLASESSAIAPIGAIANKTHSKEVTPLAIFHSHIQIISRGKGKSAVAAAAYRAGMIITNEYDGITHDYSRKSGIFHTEVMLPAHAPEEYKNRAILWNAVEKIEKAKNSQLARELDIALPVELTRVQQLNLAREYVKQTFVSAGMCADLCVHDTGNGNPHFHVMLTIRPINEDGTWGNKQKKEYILDKNGNKIYDKKKRQYKCRSVPSTDWNEQENADKWRAKWEKMTNAYLERLGHEVSPGKPLRIDRRSYAEQGVDLIPSIKMGAAASQMERKGIPTQRGDINREIQKANSLLRQLNAKIVQLENILVDLYAEIKQMLRRKPEQQKPIVISKNKKQKPSILETLNKYKAKPVYKQPVSRKPKNVER